MTKPQLLEVSQLVNSLVAASTPMFTYDLPFSSISHLKNVIKFSRHHYPNNVRVVATQTLPQSLDDQTVDFPAELCGGT